MAAPKKHAKAGGRKAGIPNKVNRELRDIARSYTEEAVRIAARIMRSNKAPEAARLTAVSIILDRGHGKPAQAMHHSGAIASYDLTKVSDDALRQLEDILESASDTVGHPSGEAAAGG
jgi:hypothetical protein